MINKRIFGQEGEAIAQSFLERQGYRILEKNFRNRLGEIDIIAEDRGTICFVEVKVRRSASKGGPLDAVSRKKQVQLARVALSYINFKRLYERKARFDVVGISYDENRNLKVQIIQDAFQMDDMRYR